MIEQTRQTTISFPVRVWNTHELRINQSKRQSHSNENLHWICHRSIWLSLKSWSEQVTKLIRCLLYLSQRSPSVLHRFSSSTHWFASEGCCSGSSSCQTKEESKSDRNLPRLNKKPSSTNSGANNHESRIDSWNACRNSITKQSQSNEEISSENKLRTNLTPVIGLVCLVSNHLTIAVLSYVNPSPATT